MYLQSSPKQPKKANHSIHIISKQRAIGAVARAHLYNLHLALLKLKELLFVYWEEEQTSGGVEGEIRDMGVEEAGVVEFGQTDGSPALSRSEAHWSTHKVQNKVNICGKGTRLNVCNSTLRDLSINVQFWALDKIICQFGMDYSPWSPRPKNDKFKVPTKFWTQFKHINWKVINWKVSYKLLKDSQLQPPPPNQWFGDTFNYKWGGYNSIQSILNTLQLDGR